MVDSDSSKSKVRLTSIRKVRSLFGLSGRPTLSRGLIRRSLWIAPLLAMIGLGFAGTRIRSQMEAVMKVQQESELKTLLKADLAVLELWMDSQRDYVDAAVDAPEVRRPILDLVGLASGESTTKAALLQSRPRAELEAALKHWLDDPEFAGYVVVDRSGRVLSSNEDSLIGMQSLPGYLEFAKSVLDGGAVVTPPYLSTVILTDEWGNQSSGVPTMFAGAAVKENGASVAVLGFRIRPDEEFTKILNVARIGDSGETYAFNKKGVLLSSSRFSEQLQEIGLLPYQPQVRSTLNVEIRDPQVDMTTGARPHLPRPQQPLTFMAAHAIEHMPTADEPKVNADGYRDYRGVEVIGAWTWLPKYDFGVATEVDKAEAFRPLGILRTAFWSLFGLLAAAALLLFGVTLVARRIERKMRDAVIAAGKLGQYALEEKIGEGGMGSVYRGATRDAAPPDGDQAARTVQDNRSLDRTFRARSAAHQPAQPSQHHHHLRLRTHGRGRVLLRDGIPRRHFRCNRWSRSYGPQPDGPRDPYSAAGLRLAARGPCASA